MSRTMWNAAVATGAAAVFAGVATVPAGAAEGGVSFSRVSFNKGKPIVVGVQEEVEVHATFRMTTTRKYKYGPTVVPYRGKLSNTDTLHSAVITSDCHVVNKAKGICDFEEWVYIDPRNLDFGNEDAGTWRTAAELAIGGGGDIDDMNIPLQVQRATRVTVNAAPEPVVKGRTITVTGKVTRANWDTHTYQGYAGRTVSLQFKADGASSYTTVKKVTSGSTGSLRTTVKAAKSGTWRWNYYGNPTAGAKASTGDHVVVRPASS
ncbi:MULTISPECIES: hypothetical protein [unclassified Streptomyces]|uniref:hypothetical protein n=1 Tax=unclassified Streptomyces TaxID=2593676 RepID=UPI002ED437CD|nr:hypothetical protein OH827_10985 [Streptomyces sp. NBC_00891]WSY05507.1 hypothetical protein OG464_10985 [Streptomyces sp. NBC_00890]WSZ07131.1 hypothetical protein OG704_10985 [Streptomyces sp. NBC_00869]WSZ25370.1 hypothetical protein OG498_22580 [Streptomyces sp. NBC_00870]